MEKEFWAFDRAAVSLKVSLSENIEDEKVDFEAISLSEDGIFIKSSLLWKPGQFFYISFALPDSNHEIKAKGRVVRSDDRYSIFAGAEQTDPGMEIKFTELSEEDRKSIRNYVFKSKSE